MNKFTKFLMKFAMKKPIGFSIEFGINSGGWPSLLIYRQKFGRLRARVPESYKSDDANKKWHYPDTLDIAKYFGFKLDFHIGTARYPEPKYWKMPDPNAEEWGRTSWPPSAWNSGDHWFTVTIPWMIGIFASMFVRVKEGMEPGFYVGSKTYRVDYLSSQLMDKDGNYIEKDGKPIYTWASEEEQGNIYLCYSATLRSDLVD